MSFEVVRTDANSYFVNMVGYFARRPSNQRVDLYQRIERELQKVLEGRGGRVQRVLAMYSSVSVTFAPLCQLDEEGVKRVITGYLETLPTV